jgi:hypothetical protein
MNAQVVSGNSPADAAYSMSRLLTLVISGLQLKTVPDTSKLDFNPEQYKGQQGDQNEERAQKHQQAASTYNQVISAS